MWQRFTERARKIVFYAQEEAQHFGEGYVSTEHLLLGLTREQDSVAARVIDGLGVSLNRLRAEVEKQLPRGDARPNQDMTLTPRAKRVIDLAYDEARNLNNNYIGTEHLLLGLIREGDGLAGKVLAKLGVNLEKARRSVIEIQQKEPRHQANYENSPSISPELSDSSHRAILSRFKQWADWANEFKDPRAPLETELKRLDDRLNVLLSAEQRNLMLGLCLEVANGQALEENDNWKKLRITPEQVRAMSEIGAEVAKILDDHT